MGSEIHHRRTQPSDRGVSDCRRRRGHLPRPRSSLCGCTAIWTSGDCDSAECSARLTRRLKFFPTDFREPRAQLPDYTAHGLLEMNLTVLDELAGLQFVHGLTQFRLRVHHDRAVPSHRFFNRLTRDQQEPDPLIASLNHDFISSVEQYQ